MRWALRDIVEHLLVLENSTRSWNQFPGMPLPPPLHHREEGSSEIMFTSVRKDADGKAQTIERHQDERAQRTFTNP